MSGHDHLKCKKCGKYTDFINARSYGSMPCNCTFIENLHHQEILEAIKSIGNQPERSKREDSKYCSRCGDSLRCGALNSMET